MVVGGDAACGEGGEGNTGLVKGDDGRVNGFGKDSCVGEPTAGDGSGMWKSRLSTYHLT